MQFTVNSGLLKTAMTTAFRAIPIKGFVLPILNNFLIKIEGGSLNIVYTNLEVSATLSIPVKAENMSFTIPAETIIQTLDKLPDQPLTFDIVDGKILITSKSGKYSTTSMDPENYPLIQYPRDDEFIINKVSSNSIIEGISKTLFAANNDDLNINISGLSFLAENNTISFTGTDTRKLASYSVPVELKKPDKCILTHDSAQALRILLPIGVDVSFYFSSTMAYFKYDNNIISCRLIEGKYPDYSVLIADKHTHTATVDNDKLASALKRAILYGDKITNRVILSFSEDTLEITALDVNFAQDSLDKIPCDYKSDPLVIAFSSKFLQEILAIIKGNSILFQMNGNKRAAIIKNAEPDELLTLLMPVMV